MGRGNVCVNGKYEGLYYVDWDNFSGEYVDEDGNIQTEHIARIDEWDTALLEFILEFKDKYTSFSRCNEWISNTEQAVLENSLFYIVVEDNQWSMAIKLIQKEQDYCVQGNITNLQSRHYKTYLEGIKNCLFVQFDELGIYCGAWTHGTIKKSA